MYVLTSATDSFNIYTVYIVVIEQVRRQGLPEKKPFGLKCGWGTLNAERSWERYWAQEHIKYTTTDKTFWPEMWVGHTKC